MYPNIIEDNFNLTDCSLVHLLGEVVALEWTGHDFPLFVDSCCVVFLLPWFDVHLLGLRWIFNNCFGGMYYAFLHTAVTCDLKGYCSIRVDLEDMVECELNVILLDNLGKLLEFCTLAIFKCQHLWETGELKWSVVEGEGGVKCLLSLAPLLVGCRYLYLVLEPYILYFLLWMVQPDALVWPVGCRLEERVCLGFARAVAHLVCLPDNIFGFQLHLGLIRPLQFFKWLRCKLFVQNKP